METNILVLLAVIICITGTSCQVFVAHPESTSVMEGSNVTLQCTFSEIITACTRYRYSLDPTDIMDRYQHLGTNSNGRNTTDCSILIMDFKAIDATKWKCSASIDANHDYAIMSNTANLTIIKSNELITTTETQKETSIKIVVHPESADVMEGNNVTLRCKFSEKVAKCTWYRNSLDPTEIKNRYQYSDTNAQGINTADCSLLITDFQHIDVTSWKCSALLDHTSGHGVMSHVSHLTLIKYNRSITTTETPNKIPTIKSSGFLPFLGLGETYEIIILVGICVVATTIMFSIIMCYCRKRKGKKNANSSIGRITSDASQRRSDPAFHEYTYITTQRETSEEDCMGYLVPKLVLMGENNQKYDVRYHIYQEIPEGSTLIKVM